MLTPGGPVSQVASCPLLLLRCLSVCACTCHIYRIMRTRCCTQGSRAHVTGRRRLPQRYNNALGIAPGRKCEMYVHHAAPPWRVTWPSSNIIRSWRVTLGEYMGELHGLGWGAWYVGTLLQLSSSQQPMTAYCYYIHIYNYMVRSSTYHPHHNSTYVHDLAPRQG